MCIGHSEGISDLTLQDNQRKSLSCERTFQPSTGSSKILEDLVNNLIEDLNTTEISRVGKLGIKIKSSDFRVYTREKTIKWTRNDYENNNFLFKDTASRLFDEFAREVGNLEIRLLGVRLSAFEFAAHDNKNNNNNKMNNSDAINARKRPTTILENWLNPVEDANPAKCPICKKVFKDQGDLAGINGHLDECLTRAALKEENEKEKGIE